ncbi:FAD-dependent monooxygenase [Streptomyces sp. C10-9-1]|uniref:FAD-dependent monooxygenase n=1 Tax=Streptomyces sp. C10-9-1 TaxID=1859285 RepID=UPI002111916D|nr:FAD-dependent monooxygenase [Streptomyces sp. C10-9-1]MCQ6552331.1 FAD-dependent monooxygenase [Streptomyces sp. C10-9-1]
MTDVLVAGGGVGGLAAALGLAHRGHRVTVLERREVFTETGAGIQLGPNAFAALTRLGVAGEVLDRAVRVDALRFMDGTTGEPVASMPVDGAYTARFGHPYAVVHRVDLHLPLLEACRRHPGVVLRGQHHVTGYTQRRGEVTALLAGGGRLTGDALVGADGLHSAVRSRLVGDGAPRGAGHTVYRALVPMDEVPEGLRSPVVTLWAGPSWHIVHYPVAGGSHLNLAATREEAPRRAPAGAPVLPGRVRAAFPGLRGAARPLLERARGWRAWALYDRAPVEQWTDGRVALLGDAAHPMLQYAAQGACQAVEDAVALGEALADRPADVERRLRRYAAERRERTARVQWVSRELGRRLYHAAGRARRERNAMLGALSPREMYDAVAWLHGGAGVPARAGAGAGG